MKLKGDNTTPRAQLETYMSLHGMRATQERFAILSHALSFDGHFTVDDIHALMEEEGYHISKTTAYNNLALLCDCGILQRNRFAGRKSYYEVVRRVHFHLVCGRCGMVREFSDQTLERRLLERRYRSFFPDGVSITVSGECAKCRKDRRKQKKA